MTIYIYSVIIMASKVKVTLELPQTLTKKEVVEILKREALKKKFKRTELFEKYSKNNYNGFGTCPRT